MKIENVPNDLKKYNDWLRSNFPTYNGYGLEGSELNLEFYEEPTQEIKDAILAYIEPVQNPNVIKQKIQKDYGQSISPDLIDLIQIRSFELLENETPFNLELVTSDANRLKLRLDIGALKTALTLLDGFKATHPTHADIYQGAISMITSFMTDKGYLS